MGFRSDCNEDGAFNIADAIFALSGLFQGVSVPCEDSCDSNDDGMFNIADPIYTLFALFTMGPQPLPPFPDCGTDPTADALGCIYYENCP